MKLKCPKCGYVWNWKGKREHATCPNCFYSYVKPNENNTKEEVSVGNITKSKTPDKTKYTIE